MELKRIKTITEYHRLVGLEKPEHPLISVIDFEQIQHQSQNHSLVFDFYSIALKRDTGSKVYYGQQEYDFDEGIMSFIAPGQVLRIERTPNATNNRNGYIMLIHPDFFWGTSLAKNIRRFEFFDYAINEALFLSDKEEKVLLTIIDNIKSEYHKDIDKFTQDIIISQIETLLSYADRFYQRQFVTRKITNQQILDKVENYLETYFNTEALISKGLPSVQSMAKELLISSVYLSNLLKQLTNLTAQQHIHEKLIEKAKEKLSTTSLTVSEIAFELGFEHSQSFSKLFKTKTNQSPLEFRQSFN